MAQTEQSDIRARLYDQSKVYYEDDPDPDNAGQGLANAPFISTLLEQDEVLSWLMSPAEQMALIYLLEHLKPKIAIELGTRHGGSLQVLAKFSGKVYSLDVDPDVPRQLGSKFKNVRYIIGPSKETLPPLIESLQKEQAELGFVLVDGDHSAAGVRQDLDNILTYRPSVPMFIVMHDSFNPECRQGLRLASWSANPHVRFVELDFVSGTVNPTPAVRGELWGGLSLAYLTPEVRQCRFEITGRSDLTIQAVLHNKIAL